MAAIVLNYTTKVAVATTAGEIIGLLVSARARRVLTDYDDQGQINAIGFDMETAQGLRHFRLPVDVEGVWRLMQARQQARDTRVHQKLDREQAARTSWRILKDWLEAQLALVEIGMVKADQVLLPYLEIEGQTIYEAFVGGRWALPAPEER